MSMTTTDSADAIGTTSGGLEVEGLVKEYTSGGYVLRVLDHLSFSAGRGELVVLLGPSGSGKTTLLSCLGAMMTPTSGTIRLDGTDVTELPRSAREEFRRRDVGFVFQGFNLLPSLTARENVAMPLLVTGKTPRREAMQRATELLERVELGERLDHRPSEMSGGQQQRVAVARGLVTDPALLLADEPTANLDHVQAQSVIQLLRELRDDGRIIVVSSHDARLVPVADQVVQMAQGASTSVTTSTELVFAPSEVIFRQNDHADLVYVINEGEVDVYRELPGGEEEHLNVLEAGQYFGELGAMMGFPRSASVRARTEVRTMAHPPQVFRELLERGGDFDVQ